MKYTIILTRSKSFG